MTTDRLPYRLLFVVNAFENDAPTRVIAAVADAARGAGAAVQVAALSRGGPLEASFIETMGSEPVIGLARLNRRIRAFRPHLIHFSLTKPMIVGSLLARILSVPVVTATHHGAHEWAERGAIVEPVVRAGIRVISPLFHQIISVSEAARHELIRVGIRPEQCLTIYNGVDTNRFNPALRKQRHELIASLFPRDQSDRIILIGAAGNLKRIKGYDLLLEGAARLAPSNDRLRFVIWGEGDERHRLTEQIKEHNLQSQVLLPGFKTQLPHSLAACDLFVQPSREEAFGLATAEAMASGVPPIVSNAGGLPELVEQGKSGLIFPRNDAMELARCIDFLSASARVRTELALEARTRAVNHLSLTRMCESYVTFFASALREEVPA